MDVVGSTGKSISVRAKTRCMELRFASSYSVKTSGGPSFSWLQMGENASLNSVDDEGDREMSLDAVGQAREEEEEEDLDVETDDATEGCRRCDGRCRRGGDRGIEGPLQRCVR